ncbi:MAG: DUF4443 domain-containing protein [Thermoplasmata archaeon]|nr:DUF4443 domain-containing protein [Thermoplasmata archaeon]
MFEMELASRGGAPLFQPFHILKALWCVQQAEIIGRKELSAKLAIGEGSTRKLITYLEEKEWAVCTRQGISLTNSSKNLLNSIGMLAKEVKVGDLTVNEKNFAICLRGATSLVGNGIEQRDEAIKVGASGASTLIFSEGLKFSDDYEASSVDKEASKRIMEIFQPSSGDVIIIGSAPELILAEDGAFSAAVLTLANKKL